eukprot:GHVP01029418.1.p1 GENE.GHVP01029418.1~~GHVP01029418.1.p1  ORF type:complete len:146 (+),score=28.98 GHVP01029418.1:177-614(+)
MSEEEKTRRENLAPGKQVFVYTQELLPEKQKNLEQYKFQDRKMKTDDIPRSEEVAEMEKETKKTYYVHEDTHLLQIVMFESKGKSPQIYMKDLEHNNVFYKLQSTVACDDVRNLSELPRKDLPHLEVNLDQIWESIENKEKGCLT